MRRRYFYHILDAAQVEAANELAEGFLRLARSPYRDMTIEHYVKKGGTPAIIQGVNIPVGRPENSDVDEWISNCPVGPENYRAFVSRVSHT